jgi:hypothetical protein
MVHSTASLIRPTLRKQRFPGVLSGVNRVNVDPDYTSRWSHQCTTDNRNGKVLVVGPQSSYERFGLRNAGIFGVVARATALDNSHYCSALQEF